LKLLKRSIDGVLGEKKVEGLGMKLPSIKFLLPWRIGLKSWKKLTEFGSADAGEKKFGGIGGSEAGPGDRIPGPKFVLSITWSISMIPSTKPTSPPSCCFSWSFGDLAFSIVAYLAAGDIAPQSWSLKGLEEVDVDEQVEVDEEPVRRWTRVMKSLGFVWITFGDSV